MTKFVLTTALSLTAFSAEAQTCPNADFKPRVLVMGENHCDPNSVNAKAEALKLAAEGKVVLVLENIFDTQSPTRVQGREYRVGEGASVRGLDSELLHGLVVSYMTGVEFRHACFSDENSTRQSGMDETQIRAAVNYLKTNPTARKEWDAQTAAFKTEADLGDLAAIVMGSKTVDTGNLPTSVGIARVYRAINQGLVEKARAQSDLARFSPALLAMQTDESAMAFNNAARGRSERALESAREEHFANALQKFYCQAAEAKKNVIVIIGAFHISGLLEGLPESWNDGVLTVMKSDRDPLKAAIWNKGLTTSTLSEDQMRRSQQVAMVAAEAVRLTKLISKDSQYAALANKFKSRTLIFLNHARSTGLNDDQIIDYARFFLSGNDITRIEPDNAMVVPASDLQAVTDLIAAVAKVSPVSK